MNANKSKRRNEEENNLLEEEGKDERECQDSDRISALHKSRNSALHKHIRAQLINCIHEIKL